MRRKRKTTVAAILAAVLCSLSLTAVTAFAEPGDGGGGYVPLISGGASADGFAPTAVYDTVTIDDPDGLLADDPSYSGLLLTGSSGTTYDLGTIDMTDNTAEAPIISVLPQLIVRQDNASETLDNTPEARLIANGGLWQFRVDFTSETNPEKTLSVRFGTRRESAEVAITAAGEARDYIGVSWYNGSSDADMSGTQKFAYDGVDRARDVRDEQGEAITAPHPVNLYYDYTENAVYTGSGVISTYTERSTEWGTRYLIRELEGAWTRFTPEEAASVRVTLTVDKALRRSEQLLVTNIGGTAVNEQSTATVISAGEDVLLTADASAAQLSKTVMLADNDVFTKLFEVELLPAATGRAFPTGTWVESAGERFSPDFYTLTIGFSDGVNTLNLRLSARESKTFGQTIIAAGVNGETLTGETCLGGGTLNSSLTGENPVSPDGYCRSSLSIDEHGNSIRSMPQRARYAVYYNAADNSLYTDCGRDAAKIAFEDGSGDTVYRWRILNLSNTYDGARRAFGGFGTDELTMTVKAADAIEEGALIRFNAVDGQSLAHTDSGYVDVYESDYVYSAGSVRAAIGEPADIPALKTHTLLTGAADADMTGIDVAVTGPDGLPVTVTDNAFTPTAYGDYIVTYTRGGDAIAQCTVIVAQMLDVDAIVSAFETVGTHKDEYIRSVDYADLPSYMKFSGGGIRVETKNDGGDPDSFLFTQTQEGTYGLGVRFMQPIYIGANGYRSDSDYDSLIKLAFPAADGCDAYKDKAQALIYRVTIEDASDPSVRVVVRLGSQSNAEHMNYVSAVAGGTGLSGDGYVNSEGIYEQSTLYADGTCAGGAYFSAASATPVELCYDYVDNAVYLICGGQSALVRDLDAANDVDQGVFPGFTSGEVKISVGVDLTNRYNTVTEGETTSVMPYGAFTIMGLNGTDFTAENGMIAYGGDKLSVAADNALSGAAVTLTGLNRHNLLTGSEQLAGGVVRVTYGEDEILNETFNGGNTFTAPHAGTYTVYHTSDDMTISGLLTVAPSAVAETYSNGTLTLNGTTMTVGQYMPVQAENTLTITPVAGYALGSLTVDGANVTAQVEDGAYVFAAPSDSASISAVFNPIEYTITYNAGEGTQTGSGTTEFTVESDTLVLPGAEREHYDFVGWYDGNNPVTADGFVFPPRDLTLTARYTPHEYVLTYDLNYDGAADETDTFTLLDYETFALKDAPDVMRPGDWYFDGWYTSADGGDPVTSISALTDTTVYAHWTEGFTVTFTADGETVSTVRVRSGAQVSEPADPQKSGHTFGGWTLDGQSYDFAAAVTGNITLTAVFTPIEYTVTFVIDGTETEVKAAYGTLLSAVTAPAIPDKTGYTDTPPVWSLPGETVIEGDLTVTAVYTADTYTITFDSAGGSPVDAVTVRYGEFITAPAEPTREGYVFVGWYLDGAVYTFGSTADEDLTLTAVWHAETPANPGDGGNTTDDGGCGCGGSVAGFATGIPMLGALLAFALRRKRG